MLTHSQKIIDGYKEIVVDQRQIIHDYEDLLKMVQEDRDNKRSQLDMSEYKVRELEEENKQLRRIISLYDGTVNIKG